MRVGIIGAGINGLMIANTLATEKNIDITIFEKKKALSGTSSSSTKLLHGGIRYLENGDFKTVFQSLQDRSWWYENAPEFCWPIRINIPFTKKNFFSFCKYSLGIFMYNILPKRKIMNGNNLPDINLDELKTSFVLNASFYDLQMDECRLLEIGSKINA
jgi:glycerol-3-phosphate dehydrogenase